MGSGWIGQVPVILNDSVQPRSTGRCLPERPAREHQNHCALLSSPPVRVKIRTAIPLWGPFLREIRCIQCGIFVLSDPSRLDAFPRRRSNTPAVYEERWTPNLLHPLVSQTKSAKRLITVELQLWGGAVGTANLEVSFDGSNTAGLTALKNDRWQRCALEGHPS